MAIAKIIKNTTNAAIFIAESGQNVPAGGQITIDPSLYYIWAKPEMITEITSAVNAGNLVINNGLADLDAVTGLRYLAHPERIAVTWNSSVVKKVVTDMDVQGDATVTDGGNGKINLIIGQNNTPVGKLYTVVACAPGATTNKWLQVEHPTSPSNQDPFVIPGAGIVIGSTYSNSNNSSECDIEFYKNGSLAYTWQIRNKRLAWKNLNSGFFSVAVGDRLSIFLRKVTGTDAKDPIVHLSVMMTSFPDVDSGIENGV